MDSISYCFRIDTKHWFSKFSWSQSHWEGPKRQLSLTREVLKQQDMNQGLTMCISNKLPGDLGCWSRDQLQKTWMDMKVLVASSFLLDYFLLQRNSLAVKEPVLLFTDPLDLRRDSDLKSLKWHIITGKLLKTFEPHSSSVFFIISLPVPRLQQISQALS